jgi:hypothetical protein
MRFAICGSGSMQQQDMGGRKQMQYERLACFMQIIAGTEIKLQSIT